jgi:2-keto-3-deoxy-L-rhamnonate aldolase RhmA
MNPGTRISGFRERLRRGERLIGTFLKTPHPSVVEVLGRAPLDCLCIDAEHSPFDRAALDITLLAARASDLPCLVRVPRADAADILNALDLGATGVLVPHVASRSSAAAIATAARYGRGGRGFSGATRAAGYGTQAFRDVIARANAEVTLVAQIEDAEALDEIDAIAAVEGIDCLFVGRMDLTVSLGASDPGDTAVIGAVRAICAAGRRHGRAIGMFTPTTEEAGRWFAAGASLFLLGSDQQWILQGANDLAARFRQL